MKTKPFIILAALAVIASAQAADKTWTGAGGDNNWLTGANWGGAAPLAADSLFFGGATRLTPSNNFAPNTQFNGLTFNSGASSFTLSGSAINLAGNITNESANNQTISTSLALQQNIVVNTGSTGNTTAGGTTLGTGIISGAFSMEKTGSGRLSLAGANNFSGGVRISNGVLSVNNATGLGTGITTLGSAGGTENVMLAIASVNSSNNIVVGAGTGTRTIQAQGGNPVFSGTVSLFNDVILDTIGNNALGLTGAITGTNTITVRQSAGTTGTVSISNGLSRTSFTGNVSVETGARFNAGNTLGVLDIAGATINLATGATFLFNNGATVAGMTGVSGSTTDMGGGSNRVLTFGGSGNYTYAGALTNSGSFDGSLTARLNFGAERGTQTISGTSSLRGGTAIQAGRLILDYGTNNTSKLADAAVLTLRSGTLELTGGNHTEVVSSTTMATAGQVNIIGTSGNATLNLGAITMSTGDVSSINSGALNISGDNIATTTTLTTNGTLGTRARITVGGANWATTSGSNIVGLSSYTGFNGTNGNAGSNFDLTGSASLSSNQSLNTLKIGTSGSGQSLGLGNQTLSFTASGLLFTGAHNYSITTNGTAGALSGAIILHNYGSGTLTLGRLSGSVLEHAGTGRTILTTASTGGTTNAQTGFYLTSGTVQFSNNNQIAGQGNLIIQSGMLAADTSTGNISLTNSSGSGHRNIGLGTDIPTIDVIGGGTLTIGGVISSSNSLVTPIIFGSASSNGTIRLTGNNTYTGDTRIDGGRVSVDSANALGVATGYKVAFSRNSTLNTTANITTSRVYEIQTGVTGTIETDSSTTLTQNGSIYGAGHLRKAGNGTLTLGGVNTYTGLTTISAGTLVLSSTGTIDNSSGVVLGTVGSPGTLDVTAKTSYSFGTGQTVSGNGTINIGAGKTVTVNGNLNPGNSTGIVSVTGNLTLAGTTATNLELAGSGGVAGTDFDQINVSGTFASDGVLSITSFGGWNLATTASYNLFDFASFTGNFDSVSIGGNALTFDAVNTWSRTDGGITYSLTLDNGVLAVIPEPSTWVLLAGGMMALAALRRRRKDA